MKRLFALLLVIVLLCPAALAETDVEKVNAIYAAVKNKKMPVIPGQAVPYGKLLIAVYEDGAEKTPQLSSDKMDGTSYHGIPADMLASGFADAQTLILLYPTEVSLDLDSYIYTTVCVVDLFSQVRYEPWAAGSKKKTDAPESSPTDGLTIGGPGDVSMDVDQAMESVLTCFDAIALAEDEELYRAAIQHFDEGLFYTASVEFRQSLWKDWYERRAACVQSWPENGEVWSNYHSPSEEVQITVRVKQPEDFGMFIRFYLEGEAYSGMFIGGEGRAKVNLPAGEYIMKAGTGNTWYGGREMFGKDGYYETFTFDEDGTETYELQTGYSYLLTIYVNQADGKSSVGSVEETWENVRE